MTDEVVIRRIVHADAQGFRDAVDSVARERRFLRRFEGPSLESAAAFVRSNLERDNPQFVAEQEGEIIGWCDIVRSDEDGERHCGELGMGVVASRRGQGIGRKLITATLAAADAAGLLRVELSVHADNTGAIGLYRTAGFTEEGCQRGARLKPGGFVDVLLMARLRPQAEWQALLGQEQG